ncbi:RNA-directed DNA polymerase [Paenibacillus peoriae]|uniref:RNA-directed DNA polymerase n=1 Tax=Paenibacillus peoriae TaxID=59893 RepID=UPI001F12F36E|nr:RNA-directed DNA polymerase [Paenibacillus peoriae]UMY53104.1 RNA-directed DNA polymerase [Paenibacillus peoriae]
MQTERFNKLRKSDLSKIFEKKTIIEVWRKIVRSQLRSLDLKDLYDHYDFNFNIEERAASIRNDILGGTYKVSQPLIYRIEKKLGVCRHLVTPQPTDALVFQVLVENISESILAKQPSKNAFYSRDKHSVGKPHDSDDYNFNWRSQWKKLQKQIYKFSDEKELIIVTDLSNYYDSIDLKELRKVFTSYTQINEVIIDLVFKIIEDISWKPDYLPYSQRGLPTTNIEGVRLLAHSFLFEIDDIIMQKTNNSFTRWMDDIIIGIDSKKQGIETISVISDMLKSRGLALNLSKTNIYGEKEAYYHFQIEANRYIDMVEKKLKEETDFKDFYKELDKRFTNHFKEKNKGAKYWDKIAKRYITLYGKLNYKKLLKKLPKIYVDYPVLRENLIKYLNNIGYCEETSQNVLEIMKTIDIFDDRSLYQLCYLVTQWEVPNNNESKLFLEEFEKLISKFSFERAHPTDFYCLLWFKSKYNHSEELLKFVRKYKNKWQTDTFLRRQVTATLSRLLNFNNKVVEEILYSQISSGVPNTVTLANQILLFSSLDKVEPKMMMYLFQPKIQSPYPLGKFLVLCSALNSEQIRNNDAIKLKIKEHIHDPYYLKWLEMQYNIS